MREYPYRYSLAFGNLKEPAGVVVFDCCVALNNEQKDELVKDIGMEFKEKFLEIGCSVVVITDISASKEKEGE